VKIQNINCDYIRLLSSVYEKNYLVDNLKGIEISIGVNDDTAVVKELLTESLIDEWSVTINFNVNTKINQIYLKNLVSEIEFNLLEDNSSFLVNESNLIIMQSQMITSLEELNITGVTHHFELSATQLQIIFTGLPANLSISRLITTETVSEIISQHFFQYMDDNDVILNGTHILIKPSFFNSALASSSSASAIKITGPVQPIPVSA
jgi:hypothetical protein